MAGAGAKLFTSGSVLTAAQVNTYLMDQAVMRFADEAARTAAFGGAGEPTLAEGMMSYLMDTNSVQVYDGTQWIAIAGGADILQVQVFS
jgi:nitrogen fixation protein FixH